MKGDPRVDRVRDCAVCGTPLAYDLNTREYFHGQEDRQDHVVVPVLPGEIHVVPLCDFCGLETALAEVWTVPARSFDMPKYGSSSIGDWAACSACAEQVRRRSWSALVNRVLATYQGLYGTPPAEMRRQLRATYVLLERNQRGKPFRGTSRPTTPES